MNRILKKYCSREWLEFIKFHSQVLDFKKGEAIFNIGDDTVGIFFVVTGKAKIQMKTPNDKTRIVRLAGEGDIIGHRGFGGTWKYTISAITLEPTQVIFITTSVFNQLVKANPEFGFYIMMFFAEELRDSESLANQCPVKNLIAQVLIKNLVSFGYKENSKELSYCLTRTEMAEMAGTTYESVVRSLSELQKEGVIKIEGKTISVLSEDKLKSSAHQS